MGVVWLYTRHIHQAHRFTWVLLLLFFAILAFTIQWAESLAPTDLAPGALWAGAVQKSLLLIVLGVFVFLFASGGPIRAAATSGVLEQLALHGIAPATYIAAEIVAQSIALGVPIALFIAAHNLLMHTPALPSLPLLAVSFLVFLNASAWGSGLASLLLPEHQGATYVLALLLLPLTLPSLLFASGALNALGTPGGDALWGPLGLMPFGEALGFLTAFTALSVPLGAWVGGQGCQQNQEI